VKFHQCRGALSGLMAALLAEQNFLATKEFLTAKDGGLYNSYANGGKPELALAELGQRWEFEQIARRLWPSASSTQNMCTALFDVVEKHKPDFDKIKKARVSLSQTVFDLHGKLANYKAKFDALISAHYVAAAILHDRALTLAQFEPARYDDPKLRRAAAELIEVRPDPAIKGNNCAVEIEMADGKKFASFCEHPRGSFENPLTREQIEAKFRTYAKGVIADAHAEEVIATVSRLEELSSVRRLMDLLRGSAAKAQAA
jgi:2-methylcitrate dehydratase PrpD